MGRCWEGATLTVEAHEARRQVCDRWRLLVLLPSWDLCRERRSAPQQAVHLKSASPSARQGARSWGEGGGAKHLTRFCSNISNRLLRATGKGLPAARRIRGNYAPRRPAHPRFDSAPPVAELTAPEGSSSRREAPKNACTIASTAQPAAHVVASKRRPN